MEKINTEIKLLEQEMRQISGKIDSLDDRVKEGFENICKNYVKKGEYKRDIKAINKQDDFHTERIDKIEASINKLIWLLGSTIIGFIIIQILTHGVGGN